MTNEDLKRFYPANAQGPHDFARYDAEGNLPGGGGGEPSLIVFTTETMNTSTLPAVAVPKLTAEQIGNMQTAISQGKTVIVSATYGDITSQFVVNESDHDGDVGGIRFTYYSYYLDYTLDGDTVVATYKEIGGGGITIDTLWENANPTSSFGQQTIDVSLTGYDYVLVECHFSTMLLTRQVILLRNVENAQGLSIAQTTTDSGSDVSEIQYDVRSIRIQNGKINLKHSYESRLKTSNILSRDDKFNIPATIYGIKL